MALTRAADQPEPKDVRPEGAIDVVVLPVNVGGDRPADGHHSRAWRDGHEEAGGHDAPQDVIETRASTRCEGAGVGVKVNR